MNKLYCVGTGPGDKELLTLKAVRIIKDAQIIFAPNNKGKNMALDTVKDYICDKKIVLLDFPMGQVDKSDYAKAAEIIAGSICPEGYGVFLTIGDPMIYSTFIYIMEELEKRNIDIEIVSGIPSFVAGAALSKTPISLKGDRFLLCDEEFEEELLDKIDCICILKTYKDKGKILSTLESKGFTYKYIKRCTLNDEKVLISKEDIVEDNDYISYIIAKKNVH